MARSPLDPEPQMNSTYTYTPSPPGSPVWKPLGWFNASDSDEDFEKKAAAVLQYVTKLHRLVAHKESLR